MKVYLLTEKDFEKLLAAIDRDPRFGETGGSSQTLSKEENQAHLKAHRWYNYHIRGWIDSVQKG